MGTSSSLDDNWLRYSVPLTTVENLTMQELWWVLMILWCVRSRYHFFLFFLFFWYFSCPVWCHKFISPPLYFHQSIFLCVHVSLSLTPLLSLSLSLSLPLCLPLLIPFLYLIILALQILKPAEKRQRLTQAREGKTQTVLPMLIQFIIF